MRSLISKQFAKCNLTIRMLERNMKWPWKSIVLDNCKAAWDMMITELRSRLKTSKMGLLQKLTDFANETSIHGVMFMAQSTSSTSRRILWTFLFFGSLIYATLQIKSIVECKLWNLYFCQDYFPSNHFSSVFQLGVRIQHLPS